MTAPDTCPDCAKPLYLSVSAANAAADVTRKYDDVRGKRRQVFHAYRCPVGGGWHLTSSRDRDHPNRPKSGRRRRRGR